MRKTSHLLSIFLIIFFLSSCNSTDGNLNSSIDSEKDLVEKNAIKIPVEETEAEPKRKPTKTEDIKALVPSGWDVLIIDQPVLAEGDLNKDGIKDIAAIIQQVKSETEEAPQRALLVAFGTMKDTYSLSIIADKVILKADEGGVWGDPFGGLYIDRGSVVVSDFGGSVEKWYDTYRFRFQNNDWYLIGATQGTYFPNSTAVGNDEDDYNLLTGDFISKRTDKNGKVKITKGNRGKKSLVKLNDFNIDEM
jgi:hypothetical protein